MNQTAWVIRVLDDSNNRSIGYQNQFWLCQNVEKMHIRVCVEDCVVDSFKIANEWGKKGTILIQEGKKIRFKSDFHSDKEALLLLNCKKDGYFVFLYSPNK